MKEFEQIKENWQNQAKQQIPEDGMEKIIKKTNYLKKGHLITNIVLMTTVVILIGFFFYIKAFMSSITSLGLALMIGVLILRILLEYLNLRRLKTIKYDESFDRFKQSMEDYYKTRIKTHYYITPIILIMYIVGFLIMMPYFKNALSEGFYLYIKVSSLVILVLGVYLIYREIKKELLILKSLTD